MSGQVMAWQAARLPGRAWLASQASQLAGRKRGVMCIVELQDWRVVGWAVLYEFW